MTQMGFSRSDKRLRLFVERNQEKEDFEPDKRTYLSEKPHHVVPRVHELRDKHIDMETKYQWELDHGWSDHNGT